MSKKYVIEMKSEYEDTTRGIMVLGARDSNLYMDALAVEDMEELNSDYINEHYGDLQDTAYQRGLEDAWEAARKIIEMTSPPYWEVFNEYKEDLFGKITATEAIEKLKAYEEKQKAEDEIKVGDEVEVLNSGSKYLIAWFAGTSLCGFAHDGVTCRLQPSDVRKTGRHFDIKSILEAMKHD